MLHSGEIFLREYQNQETPFGPRKPWIVLSGDDDGKIYVVKPVSEDRDDFNYVSELLVDSGKYQIPSLSPPKRAL